MSVFHVCMQTNNTIINETTNSYTIHSSTLTYFIPLNIISNILAMYIERYNI